VRRIPRPRWWWLAYWVIGFGLVSFIAPEMVAVVDPTPGDTLSESVAWLVAVMPGPSGELALAAFFIVL
jgi:hypothetical protein